MAQRKAAKKIPLKPEAVFVAHNKQTPAQKKPKVRKSKPKTNHKKSFISKFARTRVKKPIFYTIVSVVLAIVVVYLWIIVGQSVRETNVILDSSKKTASAAYVIAKKESDLVRIIGTRLQRQSEIQNYQSAPVDLQRFMTNDYRTFKQQCISNGTLAADVGYELSAVVYDAYAVIKRSCNGTDTLIAKKFESKWATVFSGNVLPPCALTNDLTIPQGVSFYCMQNEIRYVNPNP